MPSDKRQRQKQARHQRQEQQREAQLKTARRKTGIRLAVIMVAVIGLLSLTGVFRNKDKATEVETTDKAATFGSTPCPPARGTESRKASFDAPFKKCIVDKATYVAEIKTDVGDITIDLFADKAPVTVNNMVALARNHFYDGVPFHRVIPDFVIQGGAAGGDAAGDAGYRFADELPKPSEYKEGSLAMANSGPDTNGSQFYILTSTNAATTLVEAANGLAKYSLFGQVTSGMDVVKKIEADGTSSGTPSVIHKIVTLTIKEKKP